jgi:hypothetical protein
MVVCFHVNDSVGAIVIVLAKRKSLYKNTGYLLQENAR